MTKIPELINILKPNAKPQKVEGTVAYQYKGDLYGLMKKHLKIPEDEITINMHLNGFYNSSDYDGLKIEFKIIPSNIIAPFK